MEHKEGTTENASMLRHKIDTGRMGDKVNFPDPAAAPLGTDDEAAGTAPSRERVRMAVETVDAGTHRRPRSSWTVAAAVILLSITFGAVCWFALQ